jgi:hypothetical protein
MEKGIEIYKSPNGEITFNVDADQETIWATQAQIAQIFNVDRSRITHHLRNIFKDGELDENSVCAFSAHTAADGKTYQVKTYNLDAIISVGYRVNSRRATQFRQYNFRLESAIKSPISVVPLRTNIHVVIR